MRDIGWHSRAAEAVEEEGARRRRGRAKCRNGSLDIGVDSLHVGAVEAFISMIILCHRSLSERKGKCIFFPFFIF